MYYILLFIIAFIAVFCLMSYNRMVKAFHQLKEGFSGVDVQLKRRADLVPALYDLANQQSSHDNQLLTELTSLQKQSVALQGENSDNRQKIEKQLHQKTQELFAYLKNNNNDSQGYLSLQDEFMTLEDELQMARRYYNGCVRDYNILLETFPNNLLAPYFGFTPSDYFEEE